MTDVWLACLRCGAEYGLGPVFHGCRKCAGAARSAPLEVRYDLEKIARTLRRDDLGDPGGGFWRFGPLLPVRDPAAAPSLGEGGTPLLRHSRLNATIGAGELFLKIEGQNPTWSFKDRFNAVAVAVARELGFAKIASASTGNHGASAAAYAAAGGLRCVVLLPNETSELLADLVQAYGATAVVTGWEARGPMLEALVREHGWFPASTFAPMPVGSPYGVEGYKTIAYELIMQSRASPLDYLFLPVGGGDGIYGIYKGWHEFLRLGWADRLPRLVACQPKGANPVVQAVDADRRSVGTVERAWSIATSAREETAGDHALAAVYGSDGFALDVTEEELRRAMRLLARHGLAVEAASALAVAGVSKATRLGRLQEGSRVGALLTSTLIKWPAHLREMGGHAVRLEKGIEELRAALAAD